MSHVTDGALHAYLDGALDEYPAAEAERIREHLDGCSECTIRLKEERQIRSDATAMLGLAAPDVEIPSLEELRAYVKTTRPARPVAATRMYRMRWAASVVLALGAGWLVRDGQIQQQSSMQLDFGDEVGVATVSSESEVGEREVGASNEAVAAFEDASAPTAQPAVDRDNVLRSRGRADDVTADALSKAYVAPEERDALAPVDVVAQASTVMGEVTEGSSLADVKEELRVAGGVVSELPPPAPAYPDPDLGSRVADESTVAGGGSAVAEPESVPLPGVEPRRAESVVPVTSALSRATGFAAKRASPDDEPEADGEPSLAVPGYPVLSVTNMGEGSTPQGVHVVQRLGDDEILELFHLLPGVDPAIVPVPADGRTEIREETDGAWIIIRGRLSREELRALLVSLFPEG